MKSSSVEEGGGEAGLVGFFADFFAAFFAVFFAVFLDTFFFARDGVDFFFEVLVFLFNFFDEELEVLFLALIVIPFTLYPSLGWEYVKFIT